MKLRKISYLVEKILIAEPACRNSDNLLYLRVLEIIGMINGIDLENLTVPMLLLHMREYGLPSIESVGRVRRKVQENNPELRADDTVEGYRTLLEEEYREYAKSYIV